MSPTSAPPPLSESDYEAIESAVMETMRGRWFLAEYARRNRQADTTMLLGALDRIESALRGGERSVQSVDKIRFDLVEMAKAIARTKTEIAAIKPDAEHHGKFGEASEELDSIVQATEGATSEILASAEQIQEIAWTLREQGFDAAVCDLLDTKATDVYTACSFQDLTGQRTQKVIQVLRYLEGRINAMISIWGLDGAMAAEAAERESVRGEAALLNGPAKPGQGLDQSDVDVVMGPADGGAPASGRRAAEPGASWSAWTDEGGAPTQARPAAAPAPAAIAVEDDDDETLPIAVSPPPVGPPLQPAAEVAPPPASEPVRPAQSVAAAADPLASVTALSYEEKIALFT
jgi:chemotaxis protein CheZ